MVERVREYDFTDRVPEMARGNVFTVEHCGGSAVKFEGIPELFDPRGFAIVEEVAEVSASVVKVQVMKAETIQPETVPCGTYPGVWGGYFVRFSAQDRDYVLEMNWGIRTMNAPCTVTVQGGDIHISVN